ncbi:MAG: hypothetical protein FWG25_07655 [Promicromonosporaceae bacterium]|nr:hypothetical protein [Promicromonosporaceae bacterium]
MRTGATGLSPTSYPGTLARQSEKERIFSDFRENWLRAAEDPAFRAEIQDWDDLDDDIRWI